MPMLIDPVSRKFINPRTRFESLLKVGGDHLSTEQWSNIVEAWNAMGRFERAEYDAICRREGHLLSTTPIGSICRRCVQHY